MNQTKPPPLPPNLEAPPQPGPRVVRILLRVVAVFLALALALTLSLIRIYGTDTHHPTRSSIWWTERGRGLIPPAAVDITLQRDLLDHYATYTISEPDLNDFLNQRFASDGKTLDSFAERSPINPTRVGSPIGRLGWIATKETVVYAYPASNGGVHSYYHDPVTGSTYQSSAYW